MIKNIREENGYLIIEKNNETKKIKKENAYEKIKLIIDTLNSKEKEIRKNTMLSKLTIFIGAILLTALLISTPIPAAIFTTYAFANVMIIASIIYNKNELKTIKEQRKDVSENFYELEKIISKNNENKKMVEDLQMIDLKRKDSVKKQATYIQFKHTDLEENVRKILKK